MSDPRVSSNEGRAVSEHYAIDPETDQWMRLPDDWEEAVDVYSEFTPWARYVLVFLQYLAEAYENDDPETGTFRDDARYCLCVPSTGQRISSHSELKDAVQRCLGRNFADEREEQWAIVRVERVLDESEN